MNRTRMLGDFMYMLGVPKWAVNRHDIVFVCASAKDALEMKYAVTAFVAVLNVGILIRD